MSDVVFEMGVSWKLRCNHTISEARMMVLNQHCPCDSFSSSILKLELHLKRC